MRITRLKITNFRGIEALEAPVSPAGALVSGRNAAGKTSVLRAIQAALAARGVDPTAIRLGADKAEIVVDLDDVTVRRVITAKGNSVTVTNRDGFRAPKPQGLLDELLGGAAIDPVDLFLSPPKERRRQILSALPVTVTAEKLRRWVPTLRDDVDCSGHGLEVLERLRKQAYDKRTAANAGSKTVAADAARARAEADAASKDLPATTPTVADARAMEERAKAHHSALDGQRAQAIKGRERTAKARARIADLRARAEVLRQVEPDLSEADAVAEEIRSIDGEIAALERQLTALRGKRQSADLRYSSLLEARKTAMRSNAEAEQLVAQAAELEATLADATTPEPSAAELAEAEEAIARAANLVADANAAERAAILDQRAKELASAAEVAAKEAERLDDIVHALANDAPAALLAEADAIPGLSIDGETITLDGRDIEKLSSAEQMRFAVDIAKRLNSRTKLLLCDGMERLDPEQLERFVQFATEGGWQLICTRVAAGERVIEAIEATETAEAAE